MNQINFEILEKITKQQRDISNWLLLYASEKVIRKRYSKNRKERRKQLKDYKKNLPDFKYSADFNIQVSSWWADEIKWYKNQLENYESTVLINVLLYRLQTVFFQNYGHCIFYEETKKGRKPDNKEFIIENQKLFINFLNRSIKIISTERKFKLVTDILLGLKNLKQIDITERVFSASHKLLGKNWNILKGIGRGSDHWCFSGCGYSGL